MEFFSKILCLLALLMHDKVMDRSRYNPTIMVQEMLKIIILGLETEKVDGL